MAIKALPPLTVTDAEPVRLMGFDEADARPGTPVFDKHYGSAVIWHSDGALHLGGDDAVTNTGEGRGALIPAGMHSLEVAGDDDPWLIAPSGGSVTVERFQVGV